MTVVLADKLTPFDVQKLHMADIDSMSTLVNAPAVALKVAVANGDRAKRQLTVGQNAVFVIDETAIFDRQVPRLGADSCTVVVSRSRAPEGYASDHNVSGSNDE